MRRWLRRCQSPRDPCADECSAVAPHYVHVSHAPGYVRGACVVAAPLWHARWSLCTRTWCGPTQLADSPPLQTTLL